jgi:hypothetical protein
VKVLEAGVSFEAGDNSYVVKEKLVGAGGPYGAGGKGRFSVEGARVTFSGSGTMACMGDESNCGKTPQLPWSFELVFDVLAVGEKQLLIRAVSDSSSTVELDTSPMIIATGASAAGLVVQLVNGAKTSRLAKAAEALITASKERALFVRGPPATNKRKQSELFFRGGHEPDAKAIATLLEPALGKLTPKAWPGETPFDVVVVFGDE